MAVNIGSGIVRNGLVLNADAAQTINYTLSKVEVLVVAGGGGGGVCYGGGGGGGGVVYSNSYPVTPGTSVLVTVGDGGSNRVNVVGDGGQGGNSVFGNLIATGGGYGGGNCGNVGGPGGSGGGGSGTGSSRIAGGSGIPGQGFNGETSIAPGGGGGGGSGSLGYRRSGGDGLPFTISGTLRYYGGGGTGGGPEDLPGGAGGGGMGGTAVAAGRADGTPNTGGGGGGSIISGSGVSGVGGSGVVIVRYPGPQKATGGSAITQVDGYTIHTFTSTGNSTFTPISFPSNGTPVYGLQDLSNSGNIVTSVNGPTYNIGNYGTISFDGVNDHMRIAHSSTLSFPNELTISVWYFSGTSLGEILYLKGRTDADNYNPYLSTSGLYGWTGPDSRAFYAPPAEYIQTNTWYNLTVSHVSGSTPNVYRNAVLSTSHSFTEGGGSRRLGTNLNPIGINADVPRGTTGGFNGRIGAIHVYNRALTASEIEKNFNALRGRFGI